jgi:hypothetical protein
MSFIFVRSFALVISEMIRNSVKIQSEVSQKMSPIPVIHRKRSVKIN